MPTQPIKRTVPKEQVDELAQKMKEMLREWRLGFAASPNTYDYIDWAAQVAGINLTANEKMDLSDELDVYEAEKSPKLRQLAHQALLLLPIDRVADASNARYTREAQEALTWFVKAKGKWYEIEGLDHHISDLMISLLHIAAANDIDTDTIMFRVRTAFKAEQAAAHGPTVYDVDDPHEADVARHAGQMETRPSMLDY